ncbi:hypothetical protein [Uliginosibacterium gangwonense]|uniref:hypothetical protein n=1 Tax=Uliginosibacterium gangwonense TaxID=392736 RepID=UPI00037DF646|nr:hypothetical protein [Uliginosibacterium gangwonense]
MQGVDALKLLLSDLHDRHVGLTPALAASLTEQAVVCLSKYHESPVEFLVTNGGGCKAYAVDFSKPNDLMLNAYANDIDATENGAYGVSLAAVEAEARLVAVRRAETLTGADWYVAPIGTTAVDLESCFRLEVSGTGAGDQTRIKTKLREKVEQTKRGASNLPAIAAVVGFKELTVAIEQVSDEK